MLKNQTLQVSINHIDNEKKNINCHHTGIHIIGRLVFNPQYQFRMEVLQTEGYGLQCRTQESGE